LDTSGINSKELLGKTVLVYLMLSVAAASFDKIYDIFGHGVDSAAMTWMFLYPLLGGALFYFAILMFIPHITKFTGFRAAVNIHNSGIAALTLASLLKGIFEIAGTNSIYLVYYYIIGAVFIAAGLAIMLILAVNKKRIHV
jgi:hypothetical protein